jgi:hypothetical protein
LAGDLPARLRPALRRLADPLVIAAVAAPLVAALVTLWLVIPTLAPGLLSWDTAEFQAVPPVLGTGHPTGYPSYVILGFIVSHLLPIGDFAFRMNLLQAILCASVVACTVAIVQYLTGMRWVALGTGLLFLVMPTATTVSATFPTGDVSSSPLLWKLATHADYHMFHLALVAILFLLLLVWEGWRTGEDAARRRVADRWLVVAACVYGIAFTNHGLAWLLPPAIGLFVLAVAPRIVLQWRLILACVGVLAATIVILYAEMPIRAAMNAPIVYGHPDTWSGFLYVALAQQFGGSLVHPLGDLGTKFAGVMNLMAGWLGPLGYIAAMGVGTSLLRRPRYVLLSLLSAGVTAVFAASYANAEIDRYFLVPLFVAFTFVGLGLADLIGLGVWVVAAVDERFGRQREQAAAAAATATGGSAAAATATGGSAAAAALVPTALVPARDPAMADAQNRRALVAVEIAAALVLVVASFGSVAARQSTTDPGSVSMAAQTYPETWMRAVLATPQAGGLPANAVIVSWWSDSTTLWYGQRVEGLRPDILIVDDSDRINDNLGEVWDVIDSHLGSRPVFLDRIQGGVDGMDALGKIYNLQNYQLPSGILISQVMSKRGLK